MCSEDLELVPREYAQSIAQLPFYRRPLRLFVDWPWQHSTCMYEVRVQCTFCHKNYYVYRAREFRVLYCGIYHIEHLHIAVASATAEPFSSKAVQSFLQK